jgi:hypothetical protein
MRKLVVAMGIVMGSFNSYSQQVGIVTLKGNEKEVPVDYWYVINDKEMDNQMFYYNETNKTKEILKNMLAGYGQSSETPFGKDEEGDEYWIVTHPSGNIAYIYISHDENNYSMIISVTK